MLRFHLAIYHDKSMLLKISAKMGEGDFRGIGDMGKHRFAKEDPADGDSIEPAHKAAVNPGFDAMRMA
jgi:hypothetical protein